MEVGSAVTRYHRSPLLSPVSDPRGCHGGGQTVTSAPVGSAETPCLLGGAGGNRTHDLLTASQTLSQLSYSPQWSAAHRSHGRPAPAIAPGPRRRPTLTTQNRLDDVDHPSEHHRIEGAAACPPAPARTATAPIAAPDPPLALQELKILDLSRLAPGPYCSMLLADMGADVLVIDDARDAASQDDAPHHETPQDETTRRRAASDATLRRNKRSPRPQSQNSRGACPLLPARRRRRHRPGRLPPRRRQTPRRRLRQPRRPQPPPHLFAP